jgi:hypothetical protein
MNKFLLLSAIAISQIFQPVQAGGFFGSGPWSDGAYYPGGLDGKYQAVVWGRNISGVLGFAIFEGAPPILSQIVEAPNPGGGVTRNVVNVVDPFQNYFSIFVEGRVYNGAATAGINIETKKIRGTLLGTAPPALPDIAVGGTVITPDIDVVPILNRGLSGGFDADIQDSKATFTFTGDGQLSTPANNQTVTANVSAENFSDPGNPAFEEFELVSSGNIQTETTDFQLSGLRTSFLSRNAVVSGQLGGAQDGGGGGN